MDIQKEMLTKNRWSRPGTKLNKVKAVVIHWVANPTSTAIANRNFFENRKAGKTGFGSAHYIVGLKGEIVQCLPEEELAYHVGSDTYTNEALKLLSTYPNNCTIGIEMCHQDWTGKPNLETLHATVNLAAQILKANGLSEKNLWTHKEVVGWKDCHHYYNSNPGEWANFKTAVKEVLSGKSVIADKVEVVDKNKEEDVKMSSVKMTNVKDSEKITGKAALRSLVDKKVINSPDYWIGKMDEATPMWLMFEMINRITDTKAGA